MAAGTTAGRAVCVARATKTVQRVATVGASSESRCHRARGLAVRGGAEIWVVVATASILKVFAQVLRRDADFQVRMTA